MPYYRSVANTNKPYVLLAMYVQKKTMNHCMNENDEPLYERTPRIVLCRVY